MTRTSATVLGVPLDLTESFRPGTVNGPVRIREVAESLEDYSPPLDQDLSERTIADAGDLLLDGLDLDESLICIEFAAGRHLTSGFLLSYGGEHTASLPIIRAARRKYPNLAVVHYDAHLDIRTQYEGQDITHATWANVVGNELGFGSIVQLGVRSGTRDEHQRARACLHSSSSVEIPTDVLRLLSRRPIYVTIDIDVLDPSTAPGTGCPEPGGPNFRELCSSLYSLRSLDVVGADVMEVLPAYDVADITSITAAKLGREMLCMWVAPTAAQ